MGTSADAFADEVDADIQVQAIAAAVQPSQEDEGLIADVIAQAEGPAADAEETDSLVEDPSAEVESDDGAQAGEETADGVAAEDADAEDAVTDQAEADQDAASTAKVAAATKTVAEESESKSVAPLVSDGWQKSGSSWYYYKNGKVQTSTWVVTGLLPGSSTDTGLQRYYLGSTGALLVNQLFEADQDGKTSWFKSLSAGYVIRGKYTTSSGLVYFADNDGRLMNTGWNVTGDYTGGALQRYYIDETEHAAVVGYSSDGYDHYTTSEGYVGRYGFTVDGKKYWANNDGKLAVSRWVVTGDFTGGALQRYWAESDGHFATSRLIKPTDGDGAYWAYATGNNWVARGIYVSGSGNIYLGDNDGLLALGKTGWIVTGAYTNGALQRYYIDQSAHAAKPGYSEEGYAHVTSAQYGYVIRGGMTDNGKKYYADNDGLVATSRWVVTGDFTGGALQRYWAQADGSFATSRLITPSDGDGAYYAYATGNSWVARMAYNSNNIYVYVANNDGWLADGKTGWVVSGSYGQGVQRYYIDPTKRCAVVGYFEIADENGNTGVYYTTTNGYVLRGKVDNGSYVLVADNDGKLEANRATGSGWTVTDKYDGSLQRYYFQLAYTAPSGAKIYGARTGLFTVDGSRYYGIPGVGYVLRNTYALVGTNKDLFYADNDGKEKAATSGWLGTAGVSAWTRYRDTYSPTQYLLLIDNVACKVFVMQGAAGAWTPLYAWDAGVGSPDLAADGIGSPRGYYSIGNTDSSFIYSRGGEDSYRIPYDGTDDLRYFTGFVLDCGFHSTVGAEGGYSDPSQVGKKISHGCIRLLEENAKWIYYNCPVGTRVVSFDW